MNIRRCVFFAAAVLFLSITSFPQVGFNMEERMMIAKFKASSVKLEEGKAQFTKGKFDKAERKFLECLEVFPKNADAHFFMAQIHEKNNDLDKALQSIETAKACFSEIGKFYAFSHQELLNKLRDQKSQVEEYIRKREDALAALRSQPKPDQDAIRNLESEIQQNRNDIAKIDTQLREPIPMTMETPVPYFFIHGNILFKRKDFQGAVNQYLETVRVDPRHGPAYNNLANIFFMAKQYEKARDYLLQAEANGVAINPKFKQAIEEKLGIK
jgi:tetratricopeptide (TPR) repeat protein